MGSGGLFGKGLFQGTQKSLDFIPVQQSDFIFSVVVEELGFLGGTVTILALRFPANPFHKDHPRLRRPVRRADRHRIFGHVPVPDL